MENEKQELMAKANMFAETHNVDSVLPVEKSTKEKLVDNMFEQAVIHYQHYVFQQTYWLLP